MDGSGNEAGKYAATAKDVAKRYGVSRATVYNWIDTAEIPHRRIGSLIRFNMDEVDAWSEERAKGPTARPGRTPEEQKIWDEVRAREVAKRRVG